MTAEPEVEHKQYGFVLAYSQEGSEKSEKGGTTRTNVPAKTKDMTKFSLETK